MSNLYTLKEVLADLLFPKRCPICDKPVKPYGRLICTECMGKVKRVGDNTCYKCGKPLHNEEDEYCKDCMKHRHLYKQGISVFEYKSVSDAIYRFKYRGRQEYAEYFGRCMYDWCGEKIKSWKPDALVPVPIHESKLRSRGYNQAYLLAKELSKYTNIPVKNNLIARVKKTSALKDLTPEERNNILHGAFKLTDDVVKLKTIILIDDIYTTGATVDEISRAFLCAGVKNIYCVTLAIGKGL